MHELAHAKINLFLHVTGRRADGYHDVESLVVFPTVADRVQAEPADTLSFAASGPFAGVLPASSEGNLVMKAATALRHAVGTSKGASLRLEKNLPVAAGMGGGSADAAAALRLLVRLWEAELAMPALEAIAATLGSDVPACLHQHSAWITGRGEQVRKLPLPGRLHLLLVNPGVMVSTAEVFRRLPQVYRSSAPVPAFASQDSLLAWLGGMHNDLQPAALSLAPQIGDVLAFLVAQPGCLMARMSGSGATCFGIFADSAAARNAATRILPQARWWAEAVSTGV